MLASVLASNLAASAAILVVLGVRTRARVLLGARVAYALWIIVPAAMLASLLPARTVFVSHALPMNAIRSTRQALEGLGSVGVGGTVPVFRAIDLASTVAAIWLAGIALGLARLIVSQRRARNMFGELVLDIANPKLARASTPGVGPALLGVFRPLLVLPVDFESRFQPGERLLILEHEDRHLQGGHTLINGAVALVTIINWFNPLIALGARFARVDQELACDAAVVERFPGERRTYAQALLKTQVGSAPIPFGCSWPVRSPNLLMERIEMLAFDPPGRPRLLAGAALVAVLSLCAALAAWSAQPPVEKSIPSPAPAGADPLATLARDVSLVLNPGKDARIELSEDDHGVVGARTLAVGDEYRDGWKITAIASGSVTLARQGVSRIVTLSGREQSAQKPAAADGPSLAAVAASNAVLGGSPASGPEHAAAVQNAVKAGDVAQVLKLGGSAQDAVLAMATRGSPPGARNVDPSTAAFVQVGDRYGIAFQGPKGNRQIEVTPDFAGYVPSGPVESVPAPRPPLGSGALTPDP